VTAPANAALARKLTRVLFTAQALGSAGFIAAATIASVAGAALSGRETWAGVPSAAFLLGSALAAYLWGVVMDARGRRTGLVLGLWTGVFGALVAAWAIVVGSFWLLLAGLSLMGSAQAALQLGRFAAAEVSPRAQRGRAISNVVLGGAVGAILGPLLVGPMGRWSLQLGFPELTGAYAASAGMFVLALVVVFALLRPDPRDVGRLLALDAETEAQARTARPLGVIFRQPAVLAAVAAMVFGQVVMVMLMVITALHMTHHAHPLSSISAVISSHTLGMYAFSVVSGRLSDRWGRAPVIVTGAATLLLACLLAPLSPQMLPLAVSLFLLGLGWNFLFVGGSSLLADALSPAERSRTQGINDLLLGLASATGSLGSGVVFAGVGYAAMGLVGAGVALLPLLLTLWWWRGSRVRAVEA
jgi:MFS family permease